MSLVKSFLLFTCIMISIKSNKKNTDIINSEKEGKIRSEATDSLEKIQDKIKAGQSIIVTFYADWCPHW